jgi:hypothetical protein
MKKKLLRLLSVNVAGISSLLRAKEYILELINMAEELFKIIENQKEEIRQLKKELAPFKKQPKIPNFLQGKTKEGKKNGKGKENTGGKTGNRDFSSHRTGEKKQWFKGIKIPFLTVDKEDTFPEQEVCECGSRDFSITHRWQKLVQGIRLVRENINYTGVDKTCRNCGRTYKSEIPENIKHKQFSPELRVWVSLFKFAFRMSEQAIHKLLTTVGIRISQGQISAMLLVHSEKLAPSFTHLRIWGLKISQYVHIDATGLYITFLKKGKKYLQHVNYIGHEYLSIYVITRTYDGLTLTSKLFTKTAIRKIIAIMDDATTNGRWLLLRFKQLCWIHEIRHVRQVSAAY